MPLKVHCYNIWAFPTWIPSGQTAAQHVITMDTALNTLAHRDSVMLGGRNFRANYAVDGWERYNPAEIKLLNPTAKVYFVAVLCAKCMADEDVAYPLRTPLLMDGLLTKAEIDSEDWWLRDGWGDPVYERDVYGDVIMMTVGGSPIQWNWFLDVGKPGFKERYLELILESLNSIPGNAESSYERIACDGYDGIVFDYWQPNMVSRWITDYGLPAPVSYPDDSAWYVAWKVFFEYMCAGVQAAGYEVIGNCAGTALQTEQWAIDQRAACDGVVYERFVFDFEKNGAGIRSAADVAQSVAEIAADPLVTWVCEEGLTELSSDAARETSLAFYYVGMSDRCLYHHPKDDNRPIRDTLWDIDLGLPLERGIRLSVAGVTKYAWIRRFWGGCVVASCEAAPFTFTLDDRSYVDLAGTAVSGTITLAPNTGKILRCANMVTPTKIMGPLA